MFKTQQAVFINYIQNKNYFPLYPWTTVIVTASWASLSLFLSLSLSLSQLLDCLTVNTQFKIAHLSPARTFLTLHLALFLSCFYSNYHCNIFIMSIVHYMPSSSEKYALWEQGFWGAGVLQVGGDIHWCIWT